jgi:hypothetical protein
LINVAFTCFLSVASAFGVALAVAVTLVTVVAIAVIDVVIPVVQG